jgi:hypothetical protein
MNALYIQIQQKTNKKDYNRISSQQKTEQKQEVFAFNFKINFINHNIK